MIQIFSYLPVTYFFSGLVAKCYLAFLCSLSRKGKKATIANQNEVSQWNVEGAPTVLTFLEF